MAGKKVEYAGWCREFQRDPDGNLCVWNAGGTVFATKGEALAHAAGIGQQELDAGMCDDFEVYAEEVA